ncbi:MAG: PorP/SprF family type IX secretion system membrane protein [Saprospiraceae bacterium]
MTVIRLLPILLLLSFTLQAQQLSLFTQYRENATIINPAALESDFLAYGHNLSFGATYRSQWVGIPNGPKTQTVRVSYVNKDWSGVTLQAGAHIFNDQTGPTGFTGMYGRIGGIIGSDPEFSGLAFALSAGIVQFRIDADKIKLRDPGDAIGSQDQNQIYPDVGLGIYFYSSTNDGDFFYAGASVPQVLGLSLSFQDENGDFAIDRVQHFYGQLGFYKFFNDDSFLEPSLWLKYVPGATINADFNLRYQLPSALWIGAGGSSAKTVHLETGVTLGENAGFDNTIRFGYGFDYSFTSFGPYVGSTHEINLTFSFDN